MNDPETLYASDPDFSTVGFNLFCTMFRSSCPDLFCPKGVLKNFAKFTGNTCARVSFF